MRIQARNPKNRQTHIASTVYCATFRKSGQNTPACQGKIPLKPLSAEAVRLR